jgi:hypothetical protein
MGQLESFVAELLKWFDTEGRAFFVEYAPERLEALDAERARVARMYGDIRREVPVCFLGNSGVGKSTLINALVAREKVILPQGGIGPLTAQAVTVRASNTPYFRAEYLPAKLVNRTLFILERHHEAELKRQGAAAIPDAHDDVPLIDTDDLQAATLAVDGAGDSPDADRSQYADDLKRRARLMLLGSQWGDIDLPQLLDGLRLCLGLRPRWAASIDPTTAARIERIRDCLALARTPGGVHERKESDNPASFRRDLDEHAKGYLAPIIRKLEVGWDSPLLSDGAVLLDLPGLGTANDDYQSVTKEVMREARMVVLVVDRSGVSESSAQLLHSTGFLNALLHDSHDPAAEPVTLVVVMSKIDDSATEDRTADKEANGDRALPWTVHFEKRCEEAVQLIRDQTRRELQKLVESGPDATLAERVAAVELILGGLRVHPVSAPQYRRFFLRDPELPALISTPEQSRIPGLTADLRDAVARHRQRTYEHLRMAAGDFRSRVANLLQLVRSRWEEDSQTDEELAQLRRELEEFMAPLRRELDPRRGAFREFLQSTIPGQIALRVDVVGADARADITRYLRRFEDYHWATLRAAVSRGGYFNGARLVDLPGDLTLRFEEPIAVVWSKHILQELRKKTRELSEDYLNMLEQVIGWASTQGARFQPKVLEGVREQLRGDAKILATVGRDAIDELKAKVRKELLSKVEDRVRRRCTKFVDEKRHLGTGTKQRILEFFREELADSVVEGAKPAALKVLMDNFTAVAAEIRDAFSHYGSPLDHAANDLLEAHEARVRRADDKRRKRALADIAAAETAFPQSSPDEAVEHLAA